MSSICEMFGASAYYAQRFEDALKDFLLTFSELVNDPAAADTLEETLRKKTMGHLLRRIRESVTIETEWPDGLLDHALERRNYLMHKFFVEHDSILRVPDAHPRLVAELASIGFALKAGLIMIRGTIVGLREALKQLEGAGNDTPVTIKMTMSEDAIELVQKLTFSDLQHA